MGRNKLPVDVRMIVGLYKQGFSARQIAAQLNVSRDTVLRRLKESGQPHISKILCGSPL